MIYRAIGIMSGSSLDGLDIAFTEFTETGGKWGFEIVQSDCIEYSNDWQTALKNATSLSALDYQLLHTSFGRFIGEQINLFIDRYQLQHKVHLVASHGHTTFHLPEKKLTAQLGEGAAIAAATKLCVITDLRAMDVALGGQGAPIVPIGEKLLFEGFDYFLNIGGIANISIKTREKYIAFDVCAANRVLNMLAATVSLPYDDGGCIAATGSINEDVLNELNTLPYYTQPYPKSLANSFGTEVVYPMIQQASLSPADAMRTYVEHICIQIRNALAKKEPLQNEKESRMLVTGGGALHSFMMDRLKSLLEEAMIEVIVPDHKLIQFKEAMIMGLIGVLRWREEVNTLPTVTGASRAGIGGALWLG